MLIKLEDPSEADALIADCMALLTDIPSVLELDVGRPVDLGRPDVVADYDVGLVVVFADAAGYRSYLEHEQHLELVESWVPRWAWYRIHDFEQRSISR